MFLFRVMALKNRLFSGFSGFLRSHLPFPGFSEFSGSTRHPDAKNQRNPMREELRTKELRTNKQTDMGESIGPTSEVGGFNYKLVAH